MIIQHNLIPPVPPVVSEFLTNKLEKKKIKSINFTPQQLESIVFG